MKRFWVLEPWRVPHDLASWCSGMFGLYTHLCQHSHSGKETAMISNKFLCLTASTLSLSYVCLPSQGMQDVPACCKLYHWNGFSSAHKLTGSCGSSLRSRYLDTEITYKQTNKQKKNKMKNHKNEDAYCFLCEVCFWCTYLGKVFSMFVNTSWHYGFQQGLRSIRILN